MLNYAVNAINASFLLTHFSHNLAKNGKKSIKLINIKIFKLLKINNI